MRIGSLALLVSLALPLSAESQDKATLEWKFKKGDSLRYEMSSNTASDFGGNEFKNDTMYGLSLEVAGVDDKGVAELKVTYDRVKMKMTGFNDTDFDSDKDKKPEDAIGKLMAGFVGQSFTMKMTPAGKVTEVKGFSDIVEKISKDLGDDQGGNMMVQMLKTMYTDENMKSMMQTGFVALPGKAVAKGDTWDSEGGFPIPSMGELKLKSKSKLKDVRDEGKEAVIEVETKVDLGQDDSNGMFEIKEGSGNNEIIWLAEKGCMKSSKGSMKMTMEAQGMEITSETKMEMKLAPKGKKGDY